VTIVNTSVLRSPRGVVVDNQGFVFVAGEKSGSIVVISPDGNSSKEVYQIPRNQEFLGFGLQVKPSNSVVLVTIVKLTITVTNSIAYKVVLNCVYYARVKVITGNPSNKLSGCSILYNGEILFSEYNLHHNTDRVTLNDSYGNFIRTVWAISYKVVLNCFYYARVL
jgi:hypothetical protein